MIYRCLKDFYYEDGILRVLDHNDEVYFGELNYKVWAFTFAIPRSAENPDKIFQILEIDKVKVCLVSYGYSLEKRKVTYGFPEFKNHDYEAATRVMVAIMKEWERQQKLIVVPNEILELFNIRKILKKWCG